MLGWALLTIVFAKADHDINGFHAGPYVTAFLTNIYLAKVICIKLSIIGYFDSSLGIYLYRILHGAFLIFKTRKASENI